MTEPLNININGNITVRIDDGRQKPDPNAFRPLSAEPVAASIPAPEEPAPSAQETSRPLSDVPEAAPAETEAPASTDAVPETTSAPTCESGVIDTMMDGVVADTPEETSAPMPAEDAAPVTETVTKPGPADLEVGHTVIVLSNTENPDIIGWIGKIESIENGEARVNFDFDELEIDDPRIETIKLAHLERVVTDGAQESEAVGSSPEIRPTPEPDEDETFLTTKQTNSAFDEAPTITVSCRRTDGQPMRIADVRAAHGQALGITHSPHTAYISGRLVQDNYTPKPGDVVVWMEDAKNRG